MFDDPRADNRFPAIGPVNVWHADKRDATTVGADGFSESEGGVIWVGSDSGVAQLHASQYEVHSLAEICIDASVLIHERSHDELHLFYFLADEPFELVTVSDWP